MPLSCCCCCCDGNPSAEGILLASVAVSEIGPGMVVLQFGGWLVEGWEHKFPNFAEWCVAASHML